MFVVWKVIYGEDSVKYLILENKGALPTEILIKSKDGIDIMTRTEGNSQAGSQSVKSTIVAQDEEGN